MEQRGRSSMSSESVCVKPEPEFIFEQVYVKEEAKYTKEEQEWEDSAAFHGATLADLYAGHEVKDELVLGPEGLQPPDIVFTLCAQTSDARERPVQRDSMVRLERVVGHEAPLSDTCRGTAGRPARLASHAGNHSDVAKDSNTDITTEEETYVCDICKKWFTRKTQLIEHIMIHIHRSTGQEESRRGVADSVPAGAGAGRRGQQGARLLKGREQAKLYSCGACDKQFTQTSYLKRHERTHRGEKPYCCGTCKQKFAQLGHLKAHQRTHTGEKPYCCEICKRKFAQLGSLKSHERTHTGEKPYYCGTCKQKFAQLSVLKRHERTHTGEKPYCCGTCGKKFAHISNLKAHERTHTGEKPYCCGICKNKYSQIISLRRHERTHTGEKPYCCGICEKKFIQIYTLRRHERTHTGEKPYCCGTCKQKFAELCNLKRHERTHTGEKPYCCVTCNQKFAELRNLKKHERTHTHHTRF